MTEKQRNYKSEEGYQSSLYRTAVAVRRELKPGLDQAVSESGAPSLSGMLTLLARAPEECGELLKPVFERLQAEPTPMRRRHKVTLKSIAEEIKANNTTTDELAEALALIKARKAQQAEASA